MAIIKEFLEFYVALFSNENYAIRIGAYAGTIATLAFLIALLTFLLNFVIKPIVSWFKTRTASVSAIIGLSHNMVTSPYGVVGYQSPILTVTITNKDRATRYIKNPSIKTSKKVNGEILFSVPKPQNSFPVKLDYGQQITFEYDIVMLNNQIMKHLKGNDKINFIVSDTLGKKYLSKKYTVKYLQDHLQLAVQLNKQNVK